MNITIDITDNIAVIGMDDGKKNAIDFAAIDDLNAAMDEADVKASAIVLTGRPGSFCAGFNLAIMTSDDQKSPTALGLAGGAFATRLFSTGKPIIAACTGHAFTIGAFWLLACDTRIGEHGTFKFGLTETAMGVGMPEWGIELLQARINPTMFVPIVAQSEIYNPEGAMLAGFVDELVAEGEALNRATECAKKLAALPTEAYAKNKLMTRTERLARMRNSLK